MDQHAAAAPPEALNSVQELADYLTKPAQNDLQKVRAIYSWVIRSIDYDVQAVRAADPGDQSAEAALKRRKGVCGSYSNLFDALAKAAGIETSQIIGFSRGADYIPGMPLPPEPNHAWNAIKLDGDWRFIDCTWAAGYIDEGGAFVRRPDDHYFLTSPDCFVYDHLPEDPQWQLLPTPVTRNDYEKMVYLRPGFFRNNLRLVSHPHMEIVSDGSLAVVLEAPDDVLLKACVKQPQAGSDAARAFVQRDGGQLKISSFIAQPGNYALRLYAKRRGDAGNYEWAADYLVKVPEVTATPASYPEMMATFQESSSKLLAPTAGKLKLGDDEAFKLIVPGAEAVAVVIDNEWAQLEKHGDLWEGQVKVAGGEVQVAARFPGSKSFYVLLVYAVG